LVQIASAIVACLVLLTAGCATPSYVDPLTQLDRGGSSPAATQYKGLTLGVILDDNTKKAIELVQHDKLMGMAAMNPAIVTDLDSAFLTTAINDALRKRFKDVRPLERADARQTANVDAVMVLDVQIKLASRSGDLTTIVIQGIFVDDAQAVISQISGEGAEQLPSLAMSMHFKPVVNQAVERFAQALDGSAELETKLALSATSAAAPMKPVRFPTPPGPTIAGSPGMADLPAAAPAPPGVAAGRRVALVIGNAGYQNVPRLANTATDARLVAAALKKDGFELIAGGPLIDLDRGTLIKALTAFSNRLPGSAVGVFYYAGHGLQMQGANFLVPIDANPNKPSDADVQLVDVALVLRELEDSGASLKVVILDACRNNPFGGRGLRDASGGLAQMRAPEGTIISYATQPGNVALDGELGGDSPYTLALAKSIATPGLDVLSMFNEVGVEVDTSTKGTQQPWFATSPIKGRFFFAGQ
jgi:hypothetical protein